MGKERSSEEQAQKTEDLCVLSGWKPLEARLEKTLDRDL